MVPLATASPMRCLAALLVAAAMLAAGCLGPSPSSTPSSPPDEVSTASVQNDAPAPNASAAPAEPERVRKVTLVQYAGKTSTGACTFAVPGACRSIDPGSETHHTITEDGTLERFEGALTWSSNAPGGTLTAFLCGKIADKFVCLANARGPSPIKLSWDLAPLAGASDLVLGVYHTVDSPPPASASAYVPAEFKVDARLTSLARAP